MARNQKLAPLLTGRTVTAVEPPPPNPPAPASPFAPSAVHTWRVRFGDGAVLAVRTDGAAPAGVDGVAGKAVTDVRQKGTTLTLAVAGAEVVFRTAEEAGCVLLRDGKGAMEYAD